MRFADQTISSTKIKIMTDGILLQEIKFDPLLSKYSCIIVDEAHERSLNIDFILGLLKRISNEREDFKIIISSATINTSVFSEYFGGCPVVHIDSKMYPVGVIYDPVPEDAKPEELLLKVGDIVERCIEEEREGDTFVALYIRFADRQTDTVDGNRTLVHAEISAFNHLSRRVVLKAVIPAAVGLFGFDTNGFLIHMPLNDMSIQPSTHHHRALDVHIVSFFEQVEIR